MLVPDCRNDNYYNEDFLTNDGKQYLQGFDFATDFIRTAAIDDDLLNRQLPKDIGDEVKERYPDEDIKTIGDYISVLICEHLEMERDMLIVSLIESMDDDIYNAIRNKVLKENAQKDNPKEYYDSRKFAITGKKETD